MDVTQSEALAGEIVARRDGEWQRVIVAETRNGFVVRDRRRVKITERDDNPAPFFPAAGSLDSPPCSASLSPITR